MPFIPQSVFADRNRRIREHLGEIGAEAMVITTPMNFYMVSGFHLDVEPWERPVAAVIPRDGEPFLVMNELSTHHLMMAEERGSLYITERMIYTEHPRYRNRTWTVVQWGELLISVLAERGIASGRLAVEGGLPKQLAAATEAFEAVDATEFLVRMREVKYPEEIVILREAGKLSDFGQDVFMANLKPGLNVYAYDLEVARQIAEEGARRFPESRLDVRMLSLGGPASASPHGTGANIGNTYEVGHGIVNIIIVRLDGLVIENERTLFLGTPNDLQRRAYTAATDANQAAIEQMIAGNRVSAIDEAAQAVIEQAGFGENIMHRTGHGIGIAGHEYPADVAFNHRALIAGEVWSSEPGIYLYGVGGFRQDDTVVVGADAPEVLTHRSKAIEDQIVAA